MHRIKTDDTLVAIVMIIVFICVILNIIPIKAQDTPITVCHDASYPTLRFEFRNIPTSWFIYGSDAPVWGYWAGGVWFNVEHGVIVADALEQDTDGYLVGTAVLVDYTDEWTLVGDVNTVACGVVATSTPIPTQNAANDHVEPLAMVSMSNPIVSTGRTCTIKYPQIVLVCNG